MSRQFERFMIYTTYGLFIAIAVIFCMGARGWELKTEGRLDKPCAACLADFSGCMQLVDGDKDEEQDRDPKEYVRAQMYCVKIAVNCGQVNKCKTRVELDKESK